MDRDQAIKLMQDLLRRVTEKKASDLFITAGFPPAIKVDGEIRPQSERALTAEQSATLVRAIMNDRQTKEFDATKECNFAIAPPGIGRFRVSAFVQQGATGCVHPPDQRQDPDLRGAGPAADPEGSRAVQARPGASSSAAPARASPPRWPRWSATATRRPAATSSPSRTRSSTCTTHKGCVITHREVGVDTDSWQAALKNTLRQAPDVILIGEIRDRETMEYGIQFAETGHLVLATLHANSANQALDRIINFFPEERREQLLMDLSLNIRALISQRLIPRESGGRAHRGDGDHAQLAADPGPDLQGRGRQDQGSHVALHRVWA